MFLSHSEIEKASSFNINSHTAVTSYHIIISMLALCSVAFCLLFLRLVCLNNKEHYLIMSDHLLSNFKMYAISVLIQCFINQGLNIFSIPADTMLHGTYLAYLLLQCYMANYSSYLKNVI